MNNYKKPGKNNLKSKKRLLKIINTIIKMEKNTSEIVEAIYPMLRALTLLEYNAIAESKSNFKPASKKKMEEFRESWLDRQEVMRLMPISDRSLYALCKQGKLPSYNFKGQTFFKLSDIENQMQIRKNYPAA